MGLTIEAVIEKHGTFQFSVTLILSLYKHYDIHS